MVGLEPTTVSPWEMQEDVTGAPRIIDVASHRKTAIADKATYQKCSPESYRHPTKERRAVSNLQRNL